MFVGRDFMEHFEVNGHNIFLIVGVTFLASLLFVEMMKRVAIFLKVLDYPNEKRKIHTKPMPMLGGLGIFFAFLLGYMIFAPKNNLMLSILISAFLIMLLGLFDDMTKSETPMPNKYKVIVQVVVACIVVFYGGLELTSGNLFGLSFNFGVFAPFVTILIIVAIINAINLIDGLDGLCAGISSIYFLTIAIIGFILNKFGGLDIILSLIMLGSTLGYLVHNFPPAKTFMGDCGSTFLGFMIAVIALLGFKVATITSLAIPIVILAVPIFDTAFAILRRLIHHRSIGEPDKQHFHHQLLKMKFSTKKTVLIIYFINILFSTVSIFYVLGNNKVAFAIYIILMLLLLFVVVKTDILFNHKKK